jgi:tetratricopeptide (TPR) repeat protein
VDRFALARVLNEHTGDGPCSWENFKAVRATCPSFPRLREAAAGDDWLPDEASHVARCSFCQKDLQLLSRVAATAASTSSGGAPEDRPSAAARPAGVTPGGESKPAGGSELIERIRQARRRQDTDFQLRDVAAQFTKLAREARRNGDVAAQVCVLVYQADNMRHSCQPDVAKRLATRALRLAKSIGDDDWQTRAHLELAKVAFEGGNEPGRHVGLARSLLCRVSSGTAARVAYFQAKLSHHAGDLEGSVRQLGTALGLCGHADPYLQCRLLARRGFCQRLAGRLELAEADLRAGLAIAQQQGFRRLQAFCLLDLGKIASLRYFGGEEPFSEFATAQLDHAMSLFADAGDTLGEAHACGALGAHLRLQGDLVEARRLQWHALAVYVQRGHLAGEALTRRRLGQCLRDDEYHAEAREQLQAAIELYQMLGHRDGEAVATACLAKLERRTNTPEAALGLARRAVYLLRDMRGQFLQGSERTDFSRLHSWVYALAILCAVESGDPDTVVEVNAILEADEQGGQARRDWLGGRESEKESPVREVVRRIIEREHGLRVPADDPIAFETTWAVQRAAGLQDELETLYQELQELESGVFDALCPSIRTADSLSADPEEHRLVTQLCEQAVPWERTLVRTWHKPGHSQAEVDERPLTVADWERVQDVVESFADSPLDAAMTENMAWLGALMIPGGLRQRLRAGKIRRLHIDARGLLIQMPLGDCLISGRRLEDLTELVYPAATPTSRGYEAHG